MKTVLAILLMAFSAFTNAMETDGIFQCSTVSTRGNSGTLSYTASNFALSANSAQSSYHHNNCSISRTSTSTSTSGSCSSIDDVLSNPYSGTSFITLNEQKIENGIVVATFPALSMFEGNFGYAILNKSNNGHTLTGLTNFGGTVALERGTSTLTGTIQIPVDGELSHISFNCAMLI